MHLDETRRAILGADGHLLIQGGPGSGKTTIALLKAGLSLQGLPAGPTRVALDQPTAEQLETLRTAVELSIATLNPPIFS